MVKPWKYGNGNTPGLNNKTYHSPKHAINLPAFAWD